MSEDAPKNKAVPGSIPDPEVKTDKPKGKSRRYLTAKYKLEVLREADACKDNPGELGSLLRRKGLYSSHLSAWRRDRDEGRLSATTETKRGRKRNLSEVEAENFKLRKENEELRLRHEQAQKLIEAQKKIAEIFGPATKGLSNPKSRRGKL